MQMRHEDIEAIFFGWSVLGEDRVAELAEARTHVAEHVIIAAGDDFYATGIAAVGAGDGKGQGVDKAIDGVRLFEIYTVGRQQRFVDFRAHGAVADRRGQRTAGSPKADQHRYTGPSDPARLLPRTARWLRSRPRLLRQWSRKPARRARNG